MASFLKLTFGVINTLHINKIIFKKEKYYLHVLTTNMNGFNDIYYTKNDVFEICKNKHSIDYNIINEWLIKQCN
jgi:hypothetical protein